MPTIDPKWFVLAAIFATALVAVALVFILGRKIYERNLL